MTLRTLAILLAALLVTGCRSAATGAEEGGGMYSDATMRRQGEAAYREIVRSERPSRDVSRNELTLCVTQRIVAALTPEERGDLNWEVHVFDNDSANAFALPGGKIGLYSGMFRFARNEHQLATVLAHEVGHVLADHSNLRASRNTLLQAGRVLGTLAGVPAGALDAADLAAQFGLFTAFGRAEESEADALGLMLMARAGFDPGESVYLWRNMSEEGGSIPEFISTHPSHDTRIADLQALMSPARVLYESAFLQDRVMTCRPSTFLGFAPG